MNKKAVVLVGSGNAGKRFAKILIKNGLKVYVYQHRQGLKKIPGCSSLDNLENLADFMSAIIASPTSTHLFYLEKFTTAKIPTLVEKPLADDFEKSLKVVNSARKHNCRIHVGFNLRYLPIILKIGDYLKTNKLGEILHADIYVGQYLPNWRPDNDYRKTYSASHEDGGGVALDLIHEIDLAQTWFGPIGFKLKRSKKLSDLKIDTEDFVEFTTESRPYIKVTLDYLNMIKTRRYTIVGRGGAIECDIFNKKFIYKSKGGEEETLNDENLFEIKKTYESEITDFLAKVESGQKFDLSDRALGLDSLKLAVEARENVQK